MIELSSQEVNQVSGGFLQLLAAVVAVVVAPKIINDHRKEYNQWGRDMSQALYDYNHPYDPNR